MRLKVKLGQYEDLQHIRLMISLLQVVNRLDVS